MDVAGIFSRTIRAGNRGCTALRQARGFTLVELLIVIAVIGVIAALAVGRMMTAKMSSNEASAIGSLRAINSAQMTYAASCGGSGFAQTLEDLAHMPNGTDAPFISPDLSTTGVMKSGYYVTLIADAVPVTYNVTGRRSFATNRIASIYFKTDGTAIPSSMAGAQLLN